MTALKSWRALLVREYLEHRIPFLYFPLGIVVLLALAAFSAIGFHRVHIPIAFVLPGPIKLFEIGYLVLLVLWIFYLGVTLFFYFGDAFNADRRNNAMFFWKSLPLSDLKILGSKVLAGMLMFPVIILVVAAVTGLMTFLFVTLATFVVPGLALPNPLTALQSFSQLTLFGAVYFAVALLWYAPFFVWVGGLSTIFGRWSLALAFVIPGLISVLENIILFGNGPRGGYVLLYLRQRINFGLDDMDYARMLTSLAPFDAMPFINRLLQTTDWVSVGTGLLFSAVILVLASEYRRRRIA